MFFICTPMDHDIISNNVCCRVDALKIEIHIVLEEVLSLIQPKWHLGETELAPGCIECGQNLRICIHGQGLEPTVSIYLAHL